MKFVGIPFTPLSRILPADYQDGFSLPRGGLASSSLPSPRQVSLTVHQNVKKTKVKDQKRISQMVMQFGQFLDHDISITPEQDRECCNPEVLVEDLQQEEELRK